MRERETRQMAADDINSPCDFDSPQFAAFTDEVERVVKRLKSATLRAIREDFERRGRRYVARWITEALKRLRGENKLYFDERHWQIVRYVWGEEKQRRVIAKPERLQGLFAKKAKSTYADIGVSDEVFNR